MSSGEQPSRAAEGEEAALPGRVRTRTVLPFPFVPQNPYQRLLYERLRRFGYTAIESRRLRLRWILSDRKRIDVLHVHWPKPYYESPVGSGWVWSALSWARLMVFGLRLAAARLSGYVVAWTIHEVYPHEQGSERLDWVAARLLGRLADILIVHDAATARRAAAETNLPVERFNVIRHGSFAGVYSEKLGRVQTRAELGVEPGSVVYLAFGHIRGYKDLDVLLSAFARVEAPEAILVVAGLVMDDLVAAELERAAVADPRIRLRLGFVPDDRVADIFATADVAVITRGDGGTSGALVLALSLGVPVVVSSCEAYVELTQGEKAAWLFEPGDPGSLAAALERALVSDRPEKAAAARCCARSLAWDIVAADTARLFDRAVAR